MPAARSPLVAYHHARCEKSSDTNYPFLASCRFRLLWVFAGSACLLFAGWRLRVTIIPNPFLFLKKGLQPLPGPSPLQERLQLTTGRSPPFVRVLV